MLRVNQYAFKTMSVAKRSTAVTTNLHNLTNKFFTPIREAASAQEDLSKLKPFSEVPGPRNYPVIGCVPFILTSKDPKFNIKKVHQFWHGLVKKFGRIMILNVPGEGNMVAISDADDIQKVFRATMNEPIRNAFHSLKKVRDETTDNYFEKKGGLLVENYEEWWRVRSKVQTPMMKPKNIIRYLPQMDEVTLTFLDRIEELQQKYGEMPSDFLEELYKWSLESIALVALNRRLGCFEANLSPESVPMQLIEKVNLIFDALNANEMNIQWWRLFETKGLKTLKESHELFLNIAIEAIKETEEASANKSEDEEATLMETLLKTEGLTRKDVVTMILDMLFAGIDTTSHTVAFALYNLSRNKDAQKRLQEELDSVLGDGKQVMSDNDLAKLSFLKCCVKESMRMFPIVGAHARTLTDDIELSGYLIPKGIQIFVMAMATAGDEKNFARAKEFLPERWGRDRPLGPIHPFASIPFFHGSRMCIGRRIAEQEIYTLLARVRRSIVQTPERRGPPVFSDACYKFVFKIFHKYDVDYKYADIDMITRLVAMPSEPLKFEFKSRR